jgi:hypothetical protein
MEAPLLNVWNVIRERTLLLPAPLLVIRAATMNTNRNPMLRNAFQCEKGSTNPVQQLKLNARRVKRALVVTLRAKIAKEDGFKNYPATLRAVNAQLALATRLKVPRHAMRSLRVRTVGIMARFEYVIKVISVRAKPPIKPLADPEPTPPTKDPLPALNAHLERMPILLARLAWAATIAQWGLLEQKTTMRPNANDATQV